MCNVHDVHLRRIVAERLCSALLDAVGLCKPFIEYVHILHCAQAIHLAPELLAQLMWLLNVMVHQRELCRFCVRAQRQSLWSWQCWVCLRIH